MPKVNVSQFVAATRTIIVPLTFEDDAGERQTEGFKVVYKAYSPRVARQMDELQKQSADSITEVLAAIVVSIPEIGNGEGPIAITAENLDQFSNENLLAIYKAIVDDVRPIQAPKQPADSPSFSATAATARSQ